MKPTGTDKIILSGGAGPLAVRLALRISPESSPRPSCGSNRTFFKHHRSQDRLSYCAAFSNLGVGVSNSALGIAGTPPSGQQRTSWLSSGAACCPGRPEWDLDAVRAYPARVARHYFGGALVIVITIRKRAAKSD